MEPLLFTSQVAVFLGLALLVAAAAHDIMARTVPNGLALALLLLGIIARATGGGLVLGCLAAFIVFVLSALAWQRGWMGGGDVKLLAAACPLLPPESVLNFVLGTSVAGGVLAVTYILLRPVVPRPKAAAIRPVHLLRRAAKAEAWRISRGGPLPYAVAIAASGIAIVLKG